MHTIWIKIDLFGSIIKKGYIYIKLKRRIAKFADVKKEFTISENQS